MSEYKQIQNTQTEGQFVHDSQNMGVEDGFRNVSQLWLDKTLTVEQALEALEKGRETQKDVLVPGKKLAPYFVEETGEVGIEDWENEQRYRMTPHAWRQYATHCDVPTTYVNVMLDGATYKQNGKEKYKRDVEDARTFYNVLLNGCRRIPESRTFLIRTYNDETCRAVMTDQYGRIDNRWFLETLGDLLPECRVSHWDKSNPDTISANILIPDTIRFDEDSDYGGMVSVGNCEIGTRKNSGMPSLFRAICMNGCIWGQEKGVCWSQVHRGKIDHDNLAKIMLECINGQIKLVDTVLANFMAARQWIFGDVKPQQVLGQFAIDNKLNSEQTIALFAGYKEEKENGPNAFSFVNGITRFAQTQAADVWQAMDEVAGDIIAAGDNGWAKFLDKAKNVTDKDLEKILSKKSKVQESFNLIAV